MRRPARGDDAIGDVRGYFFPLPSASKLLKGTGPRAGMSGSAAGNEVTARASRVASAMRANVERFIMTFFLQEFGC